MLSILSHILSGISCHFRRAGVLALKETCFFILASEGLVPLALGSDNSTVSSLLSWETACPTVSVSDDSLVDLLLLPKLLSRLIPADLYHVLTNGSYSQQMEQWNLFQSQTIVIFGGTSITANKTVTVSGGVLPANCIKRVTLPNNQQLYIHPTST